MFGEYFTEREAAALGFTDYEGRYTGMKLRILLRKLRMHGLLSKDMLARYFKDEPLDRYRSAKFAEAAKSGPCRAVFS